MSHAYSAASNASGVCRMIGSWLLGHKTATTSNRAGGWGVPNRYAPLWDRRRVLDTATRLLYTDRVKVYGMLDRRVPFSEAPETYRELDENPHEAGEVALEY